MFHASCSSSHLRFREKFHAVRVELESTKAIGYDKGHFSDLSFAVTPRFLYGLFKLSCCFILAI